MSQITRRSFRSYRRGFTLAEVMIGILIASLIAGSALSALISAFSRAHRSDLPNDGLQISQNVATDFQALAAYDPNFLSKLTVGQVIKVNPTYATTPAAGSSPVSLTITAINAKADAASRTLGSVTLQWTAKGKTQFVNVPVGQIAIAEQACNPTAGVVTDCAVR